MIIVYYHIFLYHHYVTFLRNTDQGDTEIIATTVFNDSTGKEQM